MATESAKVLDRLSNKLDGASDYKIAQELGVSRQLISAVRAGKQHLSDDLAIKAAQLLEEEPPATMAQAAADRAKSSEARRYWLDLSRRLQRGAAVIIPALLLLGLAHHPHNLISALLLPMADARSMYIM